MMIIRHTTTTYVLLSFLFPLICCVHYHPSYFLFIYYSSSSYLMIAPECSAMITIGFPSLEKINWMGNEHSSFLHINKYIIVRCRRSNDEGTLHGLHEVAPQDYLLYACNVSYIEGPGQRAQAGPYTTFDVLYASPRL